MKQLVLKSVICRRDRSKANRQNSKDKARKLKNAPGCPSPCSDQLLIFCRASSSSSCSQVVPAKRPYSLWGLGIALERFRPLQRVQPGPCCRKRKYWACYRKFWTHAMTSAEGPFLTGPISERVAKPEALSEALLVLIQFHT
jgi:hypothetical protein